MDCNKQYTIKVTEGNAFDLILRMKSRTFQSSRPIDTDIDPTKLENIEIKVGGEDWPATAYTQDENGITLHIPGTMEVGTYDVILKATYFGVEICAAYYQCFSIMPWSYQSDAGNYLPGSPIYTEAAYVIGGPLTDPELEELKAELRLKIAEAEAAKEAADAAKEAWEQKAAELDGVAQEETLTQGVADIRDDISHIDIDTTTLAKEATLGTPEQGQPNTIFGAIAALASSDDSKQTIVDAINAMGGSATTSMTWAQLATQIENLNVYGNEVIFDNGVIKPIDLSQIYCDRTYVNIIVEIHNSKAISVPNGLFTSSPIRVADFPNATSVPIGYLFNTATIEIVNLPNIPILNGQNLRGTAKLFKANLLNLSGLNTDYQFSGCTNLIDLVIGRGFAGNWSMSYMQYNPSVAYSTQNSLCFDSDIEEYGQTFNINWDKWKWCIINHFAANLQDRTGLTAYTITFGSTVLSHFDAEMIAAFTDKNWTLA